MIFDVRRGLVVITCVSVGFVVSAGPSLVARAAEPDRWSRAIATDARANAASDDAAHRRIAELERRLKELDSQQRGEKSELATAKARNEKLVERNIALSLENQELVQSRAFEQPARDSAACETPSGDDPMAQLRYWAKQLRDSETGSGKLSPERNAAINVLLRRERQLDPHNPWRQQ